MIGLLIFAVALAFLLLGYPVAFTFAAIGIAFVVIFAEPSQLAQIPYRIYSNMGDNGEGIVLMAIPLFIFMGLILQRSNLADQLLQSMGKLFGSVRGGLAISTVLVGSVLAASTGVVGASVVAMGLISLPVMLRHGYIRANNSPFHRFNNTRRCIKYSSGRFVFGGFTAWFNPSGLLCPLHSYLL